MEFIDVKETAIKWNVSERRVQKLCEENRIDGVQRFGRSWMIPKQAEKPYDLRKMRLAKSKKEVRANVQSTT